jgi:hypothetical protein
MAESLLEEIYETSGSKSGSPGWKRVTYKRSRSAAKPFIIVPPAISKSALKRNAKKTRRSILSARLEAIAEVLPMTPETMEEEYVHRVQDALVSFFRDGYRTHFGNAESTDKEILDFINDVLIKNKLLISGGFLLKNMGLIREGGDASIDVDIYLPYTVSRDVYSTMGKLFNADKVLEGKKKGHYLTKYYKASYTKKADNLFARCGINSVTKYQKTEFNAEMDLVQSDRTSTPKKVINNFDLTFCENWYDGKDIYVKDKKALLKEATGYLEPMYVQGYKEGNVKTKGRIKKYLGRGFRISYVDPVTAEIVEINPEA